MSSFKPVADSLDAELLGYKETLLGYIKDLDILEASDKSDEEKVLELEKIQEKINKVRLEIDTIRNIITLLSPHAPLN